MDFLCSECNTPFTRRFSLNRHIETAHGNGQPKYLCDLCSMTFTRQDSLRKHERNCHFEDVESHVNTFEPLDMNISARRGMDHQYASKRSPHNPGVNPQVEQGPAAIDSLQYGRPAALQINGMDIRYPFRSVRQDSGLNMTHVPWSGQPGPSTHHGQNYATWQNSDPALGGRSPPSRLGNQVDPGLMSNSSVQLGAEVPPSVAYDTWPAQPRPAQGNTASSQSEYDQFGAIQIPVWPRKSDPPVSPPDCDLLSQAL